ncbi:MAG: lysophospholipid acyltransferase family protein [Bacteroidota bacterium]
MPTPTSQTETPLADILVSIYFWFSLFFISALLFPFFILIFLCTVLFDKRRYVMHKITCGWSTLILFINPYWTARVEGRKNIDSRKTYVMVSNHQSGADILVLFLLFTHFKWVAKKELFYIPFIGWNMWLNGYIPIERSRGRSKLQMMGKAQQAILEGNSIIMFPEGTRSKDGNLQPFKSGGFRLALETECDILPIVLKGTHLAIKKGGLTIHHNREIKVVVLPPIPFESFREKDSKELAGLVHNVVKKELES